MKRRDKKKNKAVKQFSLLCYQSEQKKKQTKDKKKIDRKDCFLKTY